MYLMVFDETCQVEVADEQQLGRSIFTFDFSSNY
jgi:hypothetical protein